MMIRSLHVHSRSMARLLLLVVVMILQSICGNESIAHTHICISDVYMQPVHLHDIEFENLDWLVTYHDNVNNNQTMDQQICNTWNMKNVSLGVTYQPHIVL